jgi:hypothetical protein
MRNDTERAYGTVRTWNGRRGRIAAGENYFTFATEDCIPGDVPEIQVGAQVAYVIGEHHGKRCAVAIELLNQQVSKGVSK